MHVTIVIPTYEEAENLRPLVKRIAALRLPDLTMLPESIPDVRLVYRNAAAEVYDIASP